MNRSIKKYTLNKLNGKLSNGKEVFIRLNEKDKNINYNIDLNIFRADIIRSAKPKYPKETYILTIEKYDSRYCSCDTRCIIDRKLEFSDVEKVIDYLDKKNILKRKDWIIEDDK